jgi:hypothetical protein
MNINPEPLREKSKREVVRELVEHVVKSDEELEEKGTRGGRTTDLKLYVCDNKGFEFGSLQATIERLVTENRVGKTAQDFFDEHPIAEEQLNGGVSFVQISTPDAGRTDEFVFVQADSYVWVLTTERKEWAKKTVEHLIHYLPSLERLYLSSDDLEELITDLDKAHVSGFTAKYHAPYRSRDATLRFHGAESNDLDTAKEAFTARPTRLEFDQANSPATAIQGSESNDGEIKLESVKKGSEAAAVETLFGLTEDYQRRDHANFEVVEQPTRTSLSTGFSVDGFTAVCLTDPDRDTVEVKTLREELEDEVLSGHQYEYGKWGQDTLFVHDKQHSEVFEIGLEPPDIVVYARETTTALSLRSFCREIIGEFDSTYSLEKMDCSLTG